jgi:hypothetical protein
VAVEVRGPAHEVRLIAASRWFHERIGAFQRDPG